MRLLKMLQRRQALGRLGRHPYRAGRAAGGFNRISSNSLYAVDVHDF